MPFYPLPCLLTCCVLGGAPPDWLQESVDAGKGLSFEPQSMGSGRDGFEEGWENITHDVMSWAENWP